MELDYSKIDLIPIFEPIKSLYEFLILGAGFISIPDFQKLFLRAHPNLKPFVDNFNREVKLKFEGTKIISDLGLYWVSTGRLMAIAIFDILQYSQYHNMIKNNEIFRFAKHVRNGASHDNRFDLNPPLAKPIYWKEKTIINTMNGTIVFPNFMTPSDLIMLMSDISEIIRNDQDKY